jgi:citrate lyase beta subunit
MQKLKPLLFIPGTKCFQYWVHIPEFYETINLPVILDLEDALQVADDATATKELKQMGRDTISRFLESDHSTNKKFVFRPNSDFEFHSDIEFFGRYQEKFWAIFIPKVESIDQVEFWAGKGMRLFPTIETTSGMSITNELSSLKDSIEAVVFGSVDLAYSEGLVSPVGPLTSQWYRDRIHQLAESLNPEIKIFDGVYRNLKNDTGLRQTCSYLLDEFGDRMYGKCVLNPQGFKTVANFEIPVEYSLSDEIPPPINLNEYRGDLGVAKQKDGLYLTPQDRRIS